jgi:uncharacterized membrane protein
MDFSPLLDAPLIIQLHLATIAIAMVLSPMILLNRKGTQFHRVTGRMWVGALGSTAVISLGIPSTFSPVHFGPIHLLSLFVIYSLWTAIAEARRGDIVRHRATMRSLAFWALVVTGAFTLIPGRRLSEVVLGL